MKEKGFTLIELLAVIVILAIIALIATPLVLKYIETSRIESFKVSVENIKDSALKYAANEQLNGKVTYPVTVDVQDLDFKGKEDYTGKVVVLKNGGVEEFIEKDNYRSGNGGFINKKTEPYLKVKEGKTAVIDDKNGYVYSFCDNDELQTDYKTTYLNDVLLQSVFEVINGTLELEMVQSGRIKTYSTGAKLIIKDNDGNVYREYKVIIFGDTNGDGNIGGLDTGLIYSYINNDPNCLTDVFLVAADLNRDGKIDNTDMDITMTIVADYDKKYNQFTNKLEQK